MRLISCLTLIALTLPLAGFKSKDDDLRIYRLPKAQAPQAAMQSAENPNMQLAQNSAARLKWDIPEGWIQDAAPGMMQLVSISVPAAEGDDDDAKASIVVLGGRAGGTVANVNRWRGQADLPPQDEAEIMASAEQLKNGAKMFDVTGENKAILAAIIEKPSETIYVKIIGGVPTVTANKEKFLEFANSVHESDGS